MAIYQIFIKLLDGRTQCLQIPFPTISGEYLKRSLSSNTTIPFHLLRLVSGSREIHDATLISASDDGGLFPSCALLLRLRGGKGGFGSLLRGAATKAGQKKTNNFDACRDMSGRRLRHVNAEKRLEEWKAEAEDRRLEKLAEEFLKKKAKEVKKNKTGDVEKYVEKYREDSARCMEVVEESVRQSFGLYEKAKRKLLPLSAPDSKRLKIWLGKKKFDESDSDDEEDDGDASDGEDEKSVVIDHGNGKVGSKGSAASQVSVSGSQSGGESSGGGSEKSNLEDDNESLGESNKGLGSGNSAGSADFIETEKGIAGEMTEEMVVASSAELILENDDSKLVVAENVDSRPVVAENADSRRVVAENADSRRVVAENTDSKPVAAQNTDFKPVVEENDDSKPVEERVAECDMVSEGMGTQRTDVFVLEESLNFDKVNSAAELEALGMDRLKAELQAHGLKCGGTLQERAARLFLLKTTPVNKLPKKVLAKPQSGVLGKMVIESSACRINSTDSYVL